VRHLPTAVIFDVEGTLVDCVTAQLESWRRTLAAAGHAFTHADLQPYSGMDGMWMLTHLLPDLPQADKEKLLHAQGELYGEEFLARVEPFPAVRDLFESLKAQGIRIALGTTCQPDQLAAYDRKLHILQLTDVMACGEMVKHGKPDPELFRICLQRLGLENVNGATVIGDTPYDARAARMLGLRAIGVLTGGFTAPELLTAGCSAVFEQVSQTRTLWQPSAE
jgi:HAD superfamily hydrolase (TIGR01509 family)